MACDGGGLGPVLGMRQGLVTKCWNPAEIARLALATCGFAKIFPRAAGIQPASLLWEGVMRPDRPYAVRYVWWGHWKRARSATWHAAAGACRCCYLQPGRGSGRGIGQGASGRWDKIPGDVGPAGALWGPRRGRPGGRPPYDSREPGRHRRWRESLPDMVVEEDGDDVRRRQEAERYGLEPE